MTFRRKSVWLIIAVIILATGLISARRAAKGSNDFDTFYQAGRHVIEKAGIYYQGEQYEEYENVGPFLYPPIAAVLFVPLALLPLPLAAFTWTLMLYLLFWGCLLLIFKLLRTDLSQARQFFGTLPFTDKLLVSIFGIAVLLDNIAMAQINFLVLALSLICLIEMQKNRGVLAGLALSAAIMIKLTPALFCLYFLVKRKWKILVTAGIALLCWTVLVPSLIYGIDRNRVYHRQWAGRMLKPLIFEFKQPSDDEPRFKQQSPDYVRAVRMTDMLVEKNQSFEAVITRLFLRDRNQFGYDAYPIYVARDYENLPVLFGGISRWKLSMAVKIIQIAVTLLLILFWIRKRPAPNAPGSEAFDYASVFLCMILFAPLARSHQFVYSLFPVIALYYLGYVNALKTKWVLGFFRLALIFYFCQVLPYGKAAGLGMWSNLILLFLLILIPYRFYKTDT